MAFDFPPAQDGLRVTNPESGVTYVYRDKYQSWIIEGVDNKATRVHTLCCTPCDGQQGDLWFNPCEGCLHIFHDGEWLPVIDCTSTLSSVQWKGEVQFVHQLPGKGNEPGDIWVVHNPEVDGEFTGTPAIYIWTSKGWVPADRYDDTEIKLLIKAEEEARIAADLALHQLIVQNKEESDAEDQKLWDALEKEEEERKAADKALYDLIDNCCTNASNELESLNEALEKETQDRIDGDKALQDQIDSLEKEQDFTNDRLDQEIADRIAGDDQLRDDLAEETAQREAADEQLLALIREKESKWMGEVPTADDLPSTRFAWNPITDFQCQTVYSMTWGPDLYIAGTSGGHAWSSDDGVFWERRNVGTAFNGNVLATFYANGVWLIGGDGGLVSRSVDGKSWSNVYSTCTSNIQDFAYGGGTYVFVTDGGVIATSSDGFSWTKQDKQIQWGSHGVDSILSITYSENLSRFVACTQRGMILISDTGLSWNLIDPNLNGSGKLLTIESVEWAGQPLLVAGGDFPNRLIYSEDSLNWVTAPKNYFGDGFPTELKDAGDHLMASLSNGKAAYARDDRIQSWTIELVGAHERLLTIAHAPQSGGITYVDGNWVTGGNFGQAFVRQPGNGLEPGDTWVVLDEMCLYTWSSNGWVTSCGGGGASGAAMKACPDGGLQVVGSDDDACMLIKTEADSALVLDSGVLKIDSTKLKITSDNVLPAGTDPGLLSAGPFFTDPDGNTWNSQADYNKWLYEDQKRQDAALENLDLDQQKQDDKWAEDQKRQDDELEAYKKEVEADQKRQDDEFKADQERQDKEIEELKDLLFSGCETPVLTAVLGSWDDQLGWVKQGPYQNESWYLYVDQSLHQNAWPDPRKDEEPTSIWINEVEYPVLSVGNASGIHWKYELAEGSLDHLVGQEISVSLCEPDGPAFVTQEEFEKDQKRQDQEIDDLKNAPPAPQMVFWGILPKEAPQGALWTDQDTLKLYVHTGGGTWAQLAQCAGDGEIRGEVP